MDSRSWCVLPKITSKRLIVNAFIICSLDSRWCALPQNNLERLFTCIHLVLASIEKRHFDRAMSSSVDIPRRNAMISTIAGGGESGMRRKKGKGKPLGTGTIVPHEGQGRLLLSDPKLIHPARYASMALLQRSLDHRSRSTRLSPRCVERKPIHYRAHILLY